MSDENKPMETIAKGAIFIFIGIIFSKFANYLYRVILARYLGPAPYGVFSLGLAVLGVVAILSLLGVPQGIVRYISHYKGKGDRTSINGVIFSALKITVPISLVFSVLIFIFSDWISITFFSEPNLGIILRILAFAVPLTVLVNNLERILIAFQAVKFNTLAVNFGGGIVKVVLSFIFVFIGLGLAWVASAFVFSLFTAVVLLFYFLQKKVYNLKGVLSDKRDMTSTLMKFSFPLLFTDLFAMLLIWLDTLILGYFLASEFVGIYNVAVPTAMLVYIVPTTIRTIFYPVMTEEYAKNNPIAGLFRSGTNLILFLSLPIAVFLALFSKQFLSIFFGADYVGGYIVLIIICFSYFIFGLSNTSNIILYIKNKTKFALVNSFVAVVLNVILNIILIPKYGLIGAAIATGISVLVRGILIISESWYFSKIFPFSLRSFIPFVVVLIPSMISLYFMEYITSFWMLLLASIIFGGLYLLILLLIRFFGKEERELLNFVEHKLPFSTKKLHKILKPFFRN